jgi:hypothetical protein
MQAITCNMIRSTILNIYFIMKDSSWCPFEGSRTYYCRSWWCSYYWYNTIQYNTMQCNAMQYNKLYLKSENIKHYNQALTNFYLTLVTKRDPRFQFRQNVDPIPLIQGFLFAFFFFNSTLYQNAVFWLVDERGIFYQFFVFSAFPPLPGYLPKNIPAGIWRKKDIHSMIEENTKNYPSIQNHI